MDSFALALAVHVLAIVVWIGGVSMVTSVILPGLRHRESAQERLAAFAAFERRFAWQAHAATLFAAASGFTMVARLDLRGDFR